MSEETLETRFLTWHNSNGDLHVRTDVAVLFIPKTSPDLQQRFKAMRRGEAVAVRGERAFSKTLSTYVFEVGALG